MSEDYYALLGIDRSASDDDIKKAYRRQAMKHHPDKTKGDKKSEEHFKKVKEAYEVLSDHNKRSQYDQFGSDWERAGQFRHGGHGGGHPFDSIFESMMGGTGSHPFFNQFRTPQNTHQQGQDIRINLPITLEQLVLGDTINITYPGYENCHVCKGTGSKTGQQKTTCGVCKGSGMQTMRHGPMVINQTCSACMGTGVKNTNPCFSCNGTGKTKTNKNEAINIQPGTIENHIVMQGKGMPGRDGPGNLVIQFQLQRHDIFDVDGVNLSCEVPIDIITATLGGQVQIPTFYGNVMLKIEPGTTHGSVLRMAGKGIKSRRGIIGDLFCKVVIDVPKSITTEQRTLLEAIQRTSLDASKVKHWGDRVDRFSQKVKSK
jgi:molecular chaperone DnaJ